MLGLWVRLEQLNPGNWSRRFANSADSDRAMLQWAKALDGYSGDEFKRGVEAVANLKYPPSCGEFAALCRPVSDAPRTYLGQRADDPAIREMHARYRPVLPSPKGKTPDEWLDEMRGILKRGKAA